MTLFSFDSVCRRSALIPFRSLLFAAPVISGILLGAPEEVAAKCLNPPNRPGVAMILNGEKVGEVNLRDDPSGTPRMEEYDWEPHLQGKTVIFANIGCWVEEDPVTGAPRIQHSVYYVTMDYLERALVRLEGLQNDYQSIHGRYAGDSPEFRSLAVPVDVRAELVTTETGWSAAIHHGFNRQVTCHLAVADPELLLPGQTLGQIHCIDTRPAGSGT